MELNSTDRSSMPHVFTRKALHEIREDRLLVDLQVAAELMVYAETEPPADTEQYIPHPHQREYA